MIARAAYSFFVLLFTLTITGSIIGADPIPELER